MKKTTLGFLALSLMVSQVSNLFAMGYLQDKIYEAKEYCVENKAKVATGAVATAVVVGAACAGRIYIPIAYAGYQELSRQALLKAPEQATKIAPYAYMVLGSAGTVALNVGAKKAATVYSDVTKKVKGMFAKATYDVGAVKEDVQSKVDKKQREAWGENQKRAMAVALRDGAPLAEVNRIIDAVAENSKISPKDLLRLRVAQHDMEFTDAQRAAIQRLQDEIIRATTSKEWAIYTIKLALSSVLTTLAAVKLYDMYQLMQAAA